MIKYKDQVHNLLSPYHDSSVDQILVQVLKVAQSQFMIKKNKKKTIKSSYLESFL